MGFATLGQLAKDRQRVDVQNGILGLLQILDELGGPTCQTMFDHGVDDGRITDPVVQGRSHLVVFVFQHLDRCLQVNGQRLLPNPTLLGMLTVPFTAKKPNRKQEERRQENVRRGL